MVGVAVDVLVVSGAVDGAVVAFEGGVDGTAAAASPIVGGVDVGPASSPPEHAATSTAVTINEATTRPSIRRAMAPSCRVGRRPGCDGPTGPALAASSNAVTALCEDVAA